jgi:hypothetical protein
VKLPHIVPPAPLSMHLTVAVPKAHVAVQTFEMIVLLQEDGQVPSMGNWAVVGTEAQAA